MKLTWLKCQGDVWCTLATVNLAHAHFDRMHGVYIIWHGGANPATVYVGKGFVRERLQAHRTDARIQAFNHLGLYVTWAAVASSQQEGVELYLANTLQPIVGERHPMVPEISVNLPWGNT